MYWSDLSLLCYHFLFFYLFFFAVVKYSSDYYQFHYWAITKKSTVQPNRRPKRGNSSNRMSKYWLQHNLQNDGVHGRCFPLGQFNCCNCLLTLNVGFYSVHRLISARNYYRIHFIYKKIYIYPSCFQMSATLRYRTQYVSNNLEIIQIGLNGIK